MADHRAAILFNSSLSKAIDEEIIFKNPATKLLKDVVQTEAKTKEALTLEQQIQLLRYVRHNKMYSRFEPMLVVMFGTGLRVGEICAVNWECINLHEGMITINKTLKYMRKKTDEGIYYDINSAKTKASEREVPILDEVKEALCKQKEYQKVMGYKSDITIRGYKDFVFTTNKRKPMYPDYVNLQIKRIVKALNIEETVRSEKEKRDAILFPLFSPHTTRHSFASRCYEADVQVKTTQVVLGHKNVNTTLDIYTHCSKDKVKKDISQLGNANIFG